MARSRTVFSPFAFDIFIVFRNFAWEKGFPIKLPEVGHRKLRVYEAKCRLTRISISGLPFRTGSGVLCAGQNLVIAIGPRWLSCGAVLDKRNVIGKGGAKDEPDHLGFQRCLSGIFATSGRTFRKPPAGKVSVGSFGKDANAGKRPWRGNVLGGYTDSCFDLGPARRRGRGQKLCHLGPPECP